MGEIQALRWDDLKDEYIEVNHSWDRKYGLKQPKAKSNRSVPLTGAFHCQKRSPRGYMK